MRKKDREREERKYEKADEKARFIEEYALKMSEFDRMRSPANMSAVDKDEFYRFKFEFERILCAWAEGVYQHKCKGN